MKRYKTSKYNFFLEKDNLLANLVTDSLVRIELDDLATIQHILSNPNEPIVLEHALDLKKHLIAQGFLIDEDFDENGFLKIRSRISRYGNTGLGLTIIPTLDCNFRCPYCYEDQQHLCMDDHIAKIIVKYVENQISGNEELTVMWFGGEPLLELSRIEFLSRHFIEICETKR